MKKYFLITLFAILITTPSFAENIKKLKIATLKGPTGMGMAKLMEDYSNDYNFDIYSAPDQLIAKIIKKEVDIAAVPANLASILYNKTKGNIKVAAINTLGILYIAENGNNISSISNLENKTIYASGKGATPEFILNYFLKKNNLKNVNVVYLLNHSDIASSLVANKIDIALIPEPFLTIAQTKNSNIRVALDLNKEWEKITNNNKLTMGVIIINKSINNNKIDEFLIRYKNSINFVNNNPDLAANLIEKHNIFTNKKIIKNSIPNSNIVFIDMNEGEKYLNDFYKILFDFNPKLIGGKIPNENFYYKNN
ncbi:NitT/TauT family transport system substrate-binding protein [Hypnocyclicus thermotrophus]|uniref:NitT/TauT family transport system substrate-binding protein n=1 Tax=Hypnocyclicus thermotrophus TaxID=1627895 RepID=A0AA46I5F5_9FUSO|nr:MqnA/MqnD/SBP family protein [Hypnocyclicus thermotrophus]TDT69706.1 NitT/TauT family transport system substrate-binding protein [Hypnocyclicus thermotrophus]